MQFYPNQLFHIYNQGNNRQTIFFTDENYDYFLWKLQAYFLPFGDIIAYCLIPNHFHLLFFVNRVEVERKILWANIDKIESYRRKIKYANHAKEINASASRNANENSIVTLNESIGICQKAYTRAINQEKKWTGSLFRKECKAKDGWIDEFISLIKENGKIPARSSGGDYRFTIGNDFAYSCFEYIHNNPKEAGLVNQNIDWKYSSAQDYAGIRKESFCNIELGRKILGIWSNLGGNFSNGYSTA